MEKFKDFITKNLYIIIAIYFILVLILPYIFTRQGISRVDFTTTGQIGDTIGGITAPFLNFLTIILIYITVREQKKTNKLMSNTNTIEFSNIIFETVVSSYKNDMERLTSSVENLHDAASRIGDHVNILNESLEQVREMPDDSLDKLIVLRTFNEDLFTLRPNIFQLAISINSNYNDFRGLRYLRKKLDDDFKNDELKEEILNYYQFVFTELFDSRAYFNARFVNTLDKYKDILNFIEVHSDNFFQNDERMNLDLPMFKDCLTKLSKIDKSLKYFKPV
ncbi:hypothetical protein GWK08_08650 [Leptobacterium flavescens]|uniref:Phage abortive infection protein n=1 Tax=Leptobacterium flavescens TaxID=472055 RepID=A0A6P0URL4_9FLAO|nr:hypothetical protein [Leptobacterium flavescens]NER13503.1 hypothetical protein [Leptobacterium flavescens]